MIPIVSIVAIAMALVGVAVWAIRRRLESDRIEEFLERGAVVVDVRSAREYVQGHFEGAINIPHRDMKQNLHRIGDPSRPVIVYCAIGGRAEIVRRFLLRSGYADVINAGGLRDMP